jgi:hypothetical protein
MGHIIKTTHLNKKGYFHLLKTYEGSDYKELLEFNDIDINNYWIIKYTNKFRLLNVDEINDVVGVLCLDKSIYNFEYLDTWFKWRDTFPTREITYLHKPMPPQRIINKIKIVDFQRVKK